MQDGSLAAKIADEHDGFISRLYPIGEKTFGRKGGLAKTTFGDGCYTMDGTTCKKR